MANKSSSPQCSEIQLSVRSEDSLEEISATEKTNAATNGGQQDWVFETREDILSSQRVGYKATNNECTYILNIEIAKDCGDYHTECWNLAIPTDGIIADKNSDSAT